MLQETRREAYKELIIFYSMPSSEIKKGDGFLPPPFLTIITSAILEVVH